MENKVVDNREEQRIERDGENYGLLSYAQAVLQPPEEAEYVQAVSKNSYIAGATRESARNKEDAIGFAEWIIENEWYHETDALIGDCWVNDNDTKMLSSKQLYEIYKSGL